MIRGLGVQTTTSSTSYLWASSTRFIPTSSIQDIFIHEAFKGFEVRFYLSIVVEGEEDVVVVFPVSLLRVARHFSCEAESLIKLTDYAAKKGDIGASVERREGVLV